MMHPFILVLCWLGVAQSILLGLYFLTQKRSTERILLGLIFITIGLRVTKSILYLSVPDVPLWVINVGFGAHAALAPLLLLYLFAVSGRVVSRNHFLHFLPALAILALSPVLTLHNFWYLGGYALLLFYTVGYAFACWYYAVRQKLTSRELVLLLTAITVFQLSYFSNYVLRLLPYETGPVIHSVIVYAITFVVMKTNGTFLPEKKEKYTNLKISQADLELYKQKIEKLMIENRPYLDPQFSIRKLSEMTGIASHILSYVFTTSFNQNFQAFINSYRVEEAKKLLADKTKHHLSIAGIAEECGFNSLSSFNMAFKKVTMQTPSAYRSGMGTPKASH